MALSEIKINRESLEKKITDIDNKRNSLDVGNAGSYSSDSDAIDEFVSVFDCFSDMITAYKAALENDLKNISAAAVVMEHVDEKAGKKLFSFITKK